MDIIYVYQDNGDSVDPDTIPGINREIVVHQGSDHLDYIRQDTEFMRALLSTPGLIAIFSGHDHDNDW